MTPIELVMVISSWAGAMASLRPALRTKSYLLLSGTVFWAVGCTLYVSSVYDWVDPLLGGRNVTNLIWRSSVICSVWILTVMAVRATHRASKAPRQERQVAALFTSALGIQAGIFFSNTWVEIDTNLNEYAGTPGRELFWDVQSLCIGGYAVFLLLLLRRAWRGHTVRSTRWGLALIGLSVVFDLLCAIEVVATGVLRMTVDSTLLVEDGLDPIIVILIGAGAIFAGLGVAVACFESAIEYVWMRWLLFRLSPLWQKVIARAPGLSLSLRPGNGFTGWIGISELEHVLYRRWVEVLDCERAGIFTPTHDERQLLITVSEQLVGPGSAQSRVASGGMSNVLGVGVPA